MVVGKNGVLNRAQNASTESAKADARSALEVALSGAQGYFFDAWNKDQTTKFETWLAENDDKLEFDGYNISVSGTTGTVQKVGAKTTYNFKLTYTDYGATIESFS